jgi:DNA processing protein
MAREPGPPVYGGDDFPVGEEIEGLIGVIEGLLSPTPAPLDDLARQAGAPVSAVAAALVELSLGGRAELLPGGLAVRLLR